MDLGLSELTKYGSVGIAVGLIILITFIVNVNQKTVKMFMKHDLENDKRHDKTYHSLRRAIEENTELTSQTNIFLKGLNGDLKKIIKNKKR